MSPEKKRPNRGQFAKGASGNPAGRPKGAPNKATTEIRDLARKLLDDDDYRESLKRRLIAGEASHMETLLHHYAFGKPSDKVEVTGGGLPVVVGLYMPDNKRTA